MTDVADLREGLAANLAAIPDVQVSAYELASPTPPTIDIATGEITYDGTMARGHDTWTFRVRAYVAAVHDIGAQKRLDRMLASSGADSVKAQAQSDRTLGGFAADTRVTTATGQQTYTTPDGRVLLGCEWTVEVLATG